MAACLQFWNVLWVLLSRVGRTLQAPVLGDGWAWGTSQRRVQW